MSGEEKRRDGAISGVCASAGIFRLCACTPSNCSYTGDKLLCMQSIIKLLNPFNLKRKQTLIPRKLKILLSLEQLLKDPSYMLINIMILGEYAK